MLKLYLDSSAIVKRYVVEPGTTVIDEVFDKAEAQRLTIAFSLWNIGEILGVFDERRRRGWMAQNELDRALSSFSGEVLKFMRLASLEVAPILSPILTAAWPLIVNHHIYEADALQISTCTYTASNALLSGDKRLVEVARDVGIKAYDIVEQGEKIRRFLRES